MESIDLAERNALVVGIANARQPCVVGGLESDYVASITGEIVHADAGFHVAGMIFN